MNNHPGTSPDRPLRVLHLTRGSRAGGVSRYLLDLCGQLHRHGHQPIVAGERGIEHPAFAREPWPWVDISAMRRPWNMWADRRTLIRYLQTHPVDILHAHYRKPAIVGRWLARRLKVPLVFTLHLADVPMNWWYRRLSEFGDYTHVPSAAAGRWLHAAARIPEKRIVLIPHGVDVWQFPQAAAEQQRAARAQLGLPPGAVLAAVVGRLAPQKNPAWVLDLAQVCKERLPGVRFVMLGAEPGDTHWTAQIQTRGLAEQVRLLPYGPALPVYQAADALLLPSQFEGFALTVIEAMSVGRAVLRTRTAGVDEQIIENVTGRSVPVDHDAFISAGLDFLADPARLAQMGAAAARHVRTHLTLDQQYERTIAFYRRVITEHPYRRT